MVSPVICGSRLAGDRGVRSVQSGADVLAAHAQGHLDQTLAHLDMMERSNVEVIDIIKHVLIEHERTLNTDALEVARGD